MRRRMAPSVCKLAYLSTFLVCVVADVYMHSPRGSNNKLSEQQNNVQNANRLFDSQNNGNGGYQIGDNCKPVCQNANRDYDETKPGAMQGAMTFYQGSELYIEWTSQHGCGVDHPNLRCQIILQYMSEADNPGLRDGSKRGNQNTAGGQTEPPTAAAAADRTLGSHEPLDFYLQCKARQRNLGLYTADQQVNNNQGATATRQNPNGNNNANDRHGLECPEERDYYPYWHASPWHDIAVLTDEPQVRCEYYKSESQNVKPKGNCSNPRFNNLRACEQGGGSWALVPAFGEPPPDCSGVVGGRDNHLGNARGGQPAYYVWKIPDYLKGRVVLRIRYNITTRDFDPKSVVNSEGRLTEKRSIEDAFYIDAKFNDRDPSQRRRSTFAGGVPILPQDPQADYLGIGNAQGSRVLQLQINTNQLPRTFEDRSHTFNVVPRPAEVPQSARIVNYNVRGRRGNIVQVYPAVEYDFVPTELVVQKGDFIHFQWTGSDANDKNNAGNGRQGTDRSNLVQLSARGENVPAPIESHTLFFDADGDSGNQGGRSLVDRFAYLNQDALVNCSATQNDAQATDNCKQLNGASAYFDGGLVEMKQIGQHDVVSTRNNDFSNRSQKATIKVVRRMWPWYFIFLTVVGSLAGLAGIVYIGAALYALRQPTSWLFSKRYRPRILRWVVPSATLERKVEERRAFNRERRRQWAQALTTAPGGKGTSVGKAVDAEEVLAERKGVDGLPVGGAEGLAVEEAMTMSKPWGQRTWWEKGLRRCGAFGLKEQQLAMVIYLIINVVVYLIGFLSNLDGGFKGSIAYPIAKGAGYTLDLNFAVLILPTLKSLQTAFRGASATREWIPIDDPISFHIAIAGLIILGSIVHVGAHFGHMATVASAPKLQCDPLEVWNLTDQEKASGMSWAQQFFNMDMRCAGFTGILITAAMIIMTLTALPCARRGTNCCTRRLGGFTLFWKAHQLWKWVYLLLLIHAPTRLWIWFFFPAVFVLVDRLLLASRQRPYISLKQVKAMPRDVISLTFDIPQGFAYQAGQYVLLGWNGEWHPFTLTSAPEEPRLSVHIRAPDTLDWCSALRRRLLVEAPAAAAAAAGTPVDSTRVRSVVEYVTRARGDIVYCQPAPAGFAGSKKSSLGKGEPEDSPAPPAERPPVAQGDSCPVPDVERGISRESVGTAATEADLPRDAVVLRLSGPFGAPAQKVWEFDTVMAVGAGIGVTPFASILRSVQLRAKQRQWIQAMESASTAVRRPGDDKVMLQSSGTRESMEDLLRCISKVPKRIYFYWLVRSQEELDWFYDLLAAAVEGPARDNVHISVFLTGEIELTQVKKLTCVQSQYFGRPNWGRIFKQARAQHRGEHVGVFLCGSPAIGKELAEQSAKHTDPPGCAGGTRFSFFKEHF